MGVGGVCAPGGWDEAPLAAHDVALVLLRGVPHALAVALDAVQREGWNYVVRCKILDDEKWVNQKTYNV